MTEVELKLAIQPEDASRLLRSQLLAELGQGPGRTRSLHTVYFDTPELDLARLGMALRVRRDGRRLVQTLKVRGPQRGALFDRLEIEAPTTSEAPELDLIADPELRARVAQAIEGSALAPLIETRMRRTRRLLRHGETSLELDLDFGEVKAAGERLPLCEVELELREGDPGALYDVALALLECVPLRISTLSKADLGYMCLTGSPPAPQKAKPPELAPDGTLDDTIAATLGSCLEQLLANQAPAYRGDDVEGVHQMRVGVRRLRSALRLFRPVLAADFLRPLDRELAWLGRELGAVRDLDVFVVERIDPLVAKRPGDKALELLREAAEQQRRQHHERLRRSIDSPRYTRLVLEVGRCLARRRWREQPLDEASARLFAPARGLAAELLERRDRKARGLGERVDELSLPDLHRLRIQVKRLRYASELLGDLYPGRRRDRYLARLAELQDQLGRLADLALVQGLLAGLIERVASEARPACARAAGFVEGWASAEAARATRRLAKAWRAFAHARAFWVGD
jgi:inorganic triphosphatase YgiF